MFKFTPFCYLLFFSVPLFAQAPADCPPEPSSTVFHPNNLRMTNASPIGGSGSYQIHALEAGYNGMDATPAGQYARSFWVGGLDPGGNLLLAASTFPASDWGSYLPGPINASGGIDPLNCVRWDRLWKATREEISLHRADFADNGQLDDPQPNITGWPGKGNPNFEAQYGFPLPDRPALAPFVDVNGDGIYNAYDGDYPHPAALNTNTTVAEIAWSMFNSSPGNLIFEYQSTYWALGCEDNDLLNNTIFQSLYLYNAGTERVDSLFVGLLQDPELGSYDDDYAGTNTALNTIFTYNSDNSDGPAAVPNFGDNPPTFALTILNRPLDVASYYFNALANPLPGMAYPVTPGEYYNYLTGRWRDGTPMTVGGNGYQTNGPVTSYCFNGDPNDNNSWAMSNVNFPTGDLFRILAGTKIGSLQPGQSAAVDYAYSFHRGPGLNHLQNVSYLFQRVEALQLAYFGEFEGACAYTACTDDCVWPGDTNRDGIVNHCDLLPIGVAYGESGPSRDGFVNWAPKEAIDWGQTFNQLYDDKHVDANGDGVIDLTDVDLIGDFYDNTTPWWSPVPDDYQIGDNFLLRVLPGTIDTNNIQTGQTVVVLVQYDSLLALTGGAYQIEWDTAYWQILIATGPAGGGVFRGLSRRYDTELSYARIALPPSTGLSNSAWSTIQMKARDIASTQSNTTFVRMKNVKGIAADGSDIPLGANRLKFKFADGVSGTAASGEAGQWHISPNPATATLVVDAPGEQLHEAVFYDLSGRVLGKKQLSGTGKAELPVGHLPRGLVLLQLRSEDGVVVRKVALRD